MAAYSQSRMGIVHMLLWVLRFMLSNRKPGSPCTWWADVYFYLLWASVAIKLGGTSSGAQAGFLTPWDLGPAHPRCPPVDYWCRMVGRCHGLPLAPPFMVPVLLSRLTVSHFRKGPRCVGRRMCPTGDIHPSSRHPPLNSHAVILSEGLPSPLVVQWLRL